MVNGMTVYGAIGPEWFDGEIEDRTIDRDYWRGVVGKVVTMPLSDEKFVVWEDGRKPGDDYSISVMRHDYLPWRNTPQAVVDHVEQEFGKDAAKEVRQYFKKLKVM